MLPKIKLCFVCENALGGIAGVNLSIIELLDSSIFSIMVVLINYSWRTVVTAEQLFKDKKIDLYIVSISHSRNKFKILNELQQDILAKQDIIIATDQYELIAYTIGKLKIPLLFMIHSDYEICYSTARKFSGIIDKYICVSQHIEKKLSAYMPLEYKNKINYLPHALPGGNIILNNPYEKLFTVIFIGRFSSVKGADILMNIGKLIAGNNFCWRFIIVSDGLGENEFKKQWPLLDQTKFFSNIQNKEVLKLLSEAQVILMPSRLEGFPVVLIEAMRSGVVPICSDIETGFPELIEHGENGFRLPIEHPEKFVEFMQILESDREQLNKMRNKGLAIVKDKFDPERNISNFLSLFYQVRNDSREKLYRNTNSLLGKLDKPFIPNQLFKLLRLFKIRKVK